MALLIAFSTGCVSTTASVIVKEQPPVSRLRLSRSDAQPVAATFLQDGHSVRGAVTLTNDCAIDTTRTTLRERTTTSKQSTGTTVGWLIVGGVLTAVGVGLMAASSNQDHRVICGLEDTSGNGNGCDSMSNIFVESGIGIALSGLAVGSIAVVGAYRKPNVQTEALPPEAVKTSTPHAACGDANALDGMLVAMELPNGGHWTAQVGHEGAFFFDVSPEMSLAAGEARFFVESVPAALDGIVVRGAPLGTLTLTRSTARQGRRASR